MIIALGVIFENTEALVIVRLINRDSEYSNFSLAVACTCGVACSRAEEHYNIVAKSCPENLLQ